MSKRNVHTDVPLLCSLCTCERRVGHKLKLMNLVNRVGEASAQLPIYIVIAVCH